MPSIWYVGVGLEIVSTMSGTVGKQLIRLSELVKKDKRALSRVFFVSGLIVNTVLGPVIDMAAYSFAAQSLIAPFGGLDVVWNALLAPYILKEKLSCGRIAGCFLILLGTTFAGAFGNHTESEYTLEYLEDLLVNMRVLLYFIAFFLWFLLNRFWFMRFPAGSAIRGVSLGCTAGTIAGNMFCVKAAMELIQTSIHDQNSKIWLHWLPYVMLVGAAFFAIANVGYMTKGLQEYEALFMVTIYEGSMIVSGCVSGSIVLLDLRGLEAWRVALYWLGVFIIAGGMYWIFSEEAKQKSSLLQHNASIQLDALPSAPVPRERADSTSSSNARLKKENSGVLAHAIAAPAHRTIHAAVGPMVPGISETPDTGILPWTGHKDHANQAASGSPTPLVLEADDEGDSSTTAGGTGRASDTADETFRGKRRTATGSSVDTQKERSSDGGCVGKAHTLLMCMPSSKAEEGRLSPAIELDMLQPVDLEGGPVVESEDPEAAAAGGSLDCFGPPWCMAGAAASAAGLRSDRGASRSAGDASRGHPAGSSKRRVKKSTVGKKPCPTGVDNRSATIDII